MNSSVRCDRLPPLLCALFLACALSACGLDVYYYLEPPVLISQPPLTDDAAYRYFQFQTNDAQNNTAALAAVFRGYEVYYRIYNSTTAIDSDNQMIQARNTNYSSSAVNTLQSYGYKLMQTASPQSPLIGKYGNERVRIRLYPEPLFPAECTVGVTSLGVLQRYNGKTFDFFGKMLGKVDTLPLAADLDTSYNATAGDGTWYVNAYAVTYGMSEYFSPLYSSVIYLGRIMMTR